MSELHPGAVLARIRDRMERRDQYGRQNAQIVLTREEAQALLDLPKLMATAFQFLNGAVNT